MELFGGTMSISLSATVAYFGILFGFVAFALIAYFGLRAVKLI
jgi:hypothetical protein